MCIMSGIASFFPTANGVATKARTMASRVMWGRWLAVLAALTALGMAQGFTLAEHTGLLKPSRKGIISMPQRDAAALEGSAGDTVRWFTEQRVDHFDPLNQDVWSQRYFINDTFYGGMGSPVFLCVGGEGPALEPSVVQTGGVHCALMVDLAKKYGALILALEHRFYGQSLPKADYSVESLRFLSSKQALEDIALFRKYIHDKLNMEDMYTSWATFGGSYPGMLAGWARLKYPHLFAASVASSAPVEAVADMEGYNNFVASSMLDMTIGGAPECLWKVSAGFLRIGYLLKSEEGRSQLAEDFSVCPSGKLDDKWDQKMFSEGLWNLFPLQTNDPSCTETYCNYKKICGLMTNSTHGAYEAVVELFNNAKNANGMDCYDVSYNESMKALSDVKSQDRSWLWQTCTEFGFYQTCNPGTSCPFTSDPFVSSLDSFTDMCSQLFNIDPESVANTAKVTNNHYGGWDYGGTRVVFANGGADPWSASTVPATNPELDLVVLWVAGASHHAWTHVPKPTDQDSVKDARQVIEDHLLTWLDLHPTLVQYQ